jgi:hypothetical protein
MTLVYYVIAFLAGILARGRTIHTDFCSCNNCHLANARLVPWNRPLSFQSILNKYPDFRCYYDLPS